MARTSTTKDILPPTYLFASLLLMGAVRLLMPGPLVVSEPWNLIGGALIVVGIGLNIVGDAQFKRAKTAMNPFRAPSALVTSGVFRWSRNPMYLGMVLPVLGVGILLGRATPLVAPVLLFLVLNFRFVAREEQTMAAHFADDYRRYVATVRRWL
jgi:protein-S-isoprenylcysteine O-methyltransferase Ste14